MDCHNPNGNNIRGDHGLMDVTMEQNINKATHEFKEGKLKGGKSGKKGRNPKRAVAARRPRSASAPSMWSRASSSLPSKRSVSS